MHVVGGGRTNSHACLLFTSFSPETRDNELEGGENKVYDYHVHRAQMTVITYWQAGRDGEHPPQPPTPTPTPPGSVLAQLRGQCPSRTDATGANEQRP